MNNSKKLRRSRIQTNFDPYELSLFSDSSQDELTENERENDSIQHDHKLILGPHLQMGHSSEFDEPNSRKRGVKRKHQSEQIHPLSDYLYYEKRSSDSESYKVPSVSREYHASVSQPSNDRDVKSQERRVPTFWDAQAGQYKTSGA